MQLKGNPHSALFKHGFGETPNNPPRRKSAPGWENSNADRSLRTEKREDRESFSINGGDGPTTRIFFPCEGGLGDEGGKSGREFPGGAAPGRYSDNAGEGVEFVEGYSIPFLAISLVAKVGE